MRGHRLAVRILGVAATVRGFAYALTEGPGCLVDVNTRRQAPEKGDVAKVLTSVLASGRPLFVAFGATKARRGTRESVLDDALTDACARSNVKILRITRRQLQDLSRTPAATRWDIADEVARQFPELAHRTPRKPKDGESHDDRIGLFEAVAVALAAWKMFRPPPVDDS